MTMKEHYRTLASPSRLIPKIPKHTMAEAMPGSTLVIIREQFETLTNL